MEELSALKWRLATEVDAEKIARLVNGAYRGESGRRGWTTEANMIGGVRIDAAQVRDLLRDHNSFVLLAHQNFDPSQILGCVHVESKPATAYFGMLAVNVELQSKGVGAFLLKAAEDFARERLSAKKMTMTVIHGRNELIAWYERRGYKATGETQPFPYGDERFGRPFNEGLFFRVFEKPL